MSAPCRTSKVNGTGGTCAQAPDFLASHGRMNVKGRPRFPRIDHSGAVDEGRLSLAARLLFFI
ncbi:MAG: hypothetical protein KatS3mg082_0854 [Nitrospiraceae bacterium]|nr:MAG: hypothetical protein KatS3mg082_0854 [Nitrospiraceae bacterium]